MNKVYLDLSRLEDENKRLRDEINHLNKKIIETYANYLHIKNAINTLGKYIRLDNYEDKKMFIVSDDESYLSFEISLIDYINLKDFF